MAHHGVGSCCSLVPSVAPAFSSEDIKQALKPQTFPSISALGLTRGGYTQ